MKVLSVNNNECPFAYQICLGVKDVENRSWRTKYRGKILIHSSGKRLLGPFRDSDYPRDFIRRVEKIFQACKGKTQEERFKIFDEMKITDNELNYFAIPEKYYQKSNIFHSHAIIGEANLVDIVMDAHTKDSPYFSYYAIPGQYHWIFRDAKIYDLPFFNVKGKLGLWNFKT